MSEELAQRVLDLVKDRAEAEVLASSGTSSLTRFANSSIHQNVGEYVDSVGLKVAIDGKVAMARTTRTSQAALRAFVEDTIATALRERVDEDWPGLTEPTDTPDVEHYDADTAAASPTARAELVQAFVKAGEGLLGAGYCETEDGTYPFVTSSNPTAPGVLIGLGIGIRDIGRIIGVTKAFQTRVGEGPFPTEVMGDVATLLRGTGKNPWDEFGTTTGRQRRCGWLDAVPLRYSVAVNSVSDLMVNKLDILDSPPPLNPFPTTSWNENIMEHKFWLVQGKTDFLERNLHLQIIVRVVVNHSRDQCVVSCDEEARCNGPDQQGQADDNVRFPLTDLRLISDCLAGQPPGSEAVGQGDLHRCPAIRSGSQSK